MAELNYPYADHPAPATTVEVTPGVHWLSMPMGGSLSHINLYLLDDHDGWYIVDTGLATPEVRDLWHSLFTGVMGERPVKGVICTHMHPDHTGQAGMITEHFQCPLHMTQLEFLNARLMHSSGPLQFASWQAQDHFRRAGMAPEFIERIRQMWESIAASRQAGQGAATADDSALRDALRKDSAMPTSYRRLRAGDVLEIGGREWQIVVGAGHSPEHACLYCRRLGILISGDQILPVITSNVSVQPNEPDANPLRNWIASHEDFLELPQDTFVLPAHNLPFYGIRTRLNQLIHHHEDRMLACEEHCLTPRTAVELLPVLFKRDLDQRQMMMALGEAIAHLNLLVTRHRLERTLHEDGIYRYRSIDPLLERRLNPRSHDPADDLPMQI